MEERKRGGIIFLGKRHFGQGVGRRSGELAFAVIVQDSLKIRARAGWLIQIAKALA